MKRILILSNHHLYTYNLRKELIKSLIDNGYEVTIALPYGEKIELLKDIGCKFIDVPLDRRGTNPILDLKLFFNYIKLIKKIKPNIILTFTLKPNLYGGLACRFLNFNNVIHTVTGLGTVFVRDVWYKKIIITLNKIAFKTAEYVAFMNLDNEKLYAENKIISKRKKTIQIPGSGVNLNLFAFAEYPKNEEFIKFTFIARILKDKGIEEFLEAAKQIKKEYKNIIFEVVGFVDEVKYSEQLRRFEENGIIKYLGKKDDIPKIMKNSHCIVLPSYGEGRGTVLQEAASIGRPLITCDTYGCRDNVDAGINGYLCEVKNVDSLKDAFVKFINLEYEEKIIMGKKSREKAEDEFDRNIVLKKYNEVLKTM